MASSSRSRRILLWIVLVPIASAAGVEGGARAIDRIRGKPWDEAERRAAIEETCKMLARPAYMPGGHQDEERARIAPSAAILHPFTSWEHLQTQDRIAAELDDYRAPEGKEAYDISILGGSVAQFFAQVGEARLRERLQRDPRFQGREIRVHDDACAGYKQPQPLMSLSYLLAIGHEPDAVIELDGFNEAALGWNNARIGANPAYPFLPNWARATQGLNLDAEILEDLHSVLASQDEASRYGQWLLSSGWLKSGFLGHVGNARFDRLRAKYVAAFRHYTDGLKSRPLAIENKGPRFRGDDGALVLALTDCWEQASISMHGLCAERGITYLHVLQPALPDPGTKPLTPKEIESSHPEPSWIEGVLKVYPSLRQAGERLKRRGIAFHDATGVFRDHPEDIYTDACHFGQLGNDLLADAIADALLEAERR
jgi:hypothetical protein